MRSSTILCAVALALALLQPAAASAAASDIRSQMEKLAVVIEGVGQWESAARLRGTLDATPDEELEATYQGIDLAPLIAALRQVGGSQARLREEVEAAQGRLDAERLANVARVLRAPRLDLGGVLSAGLPDASYPFEPEFCAFHGNTAVSPTQRSDTQTVLQLTKNLNDAVQGLEQVEIVRALAQGIWNGLDRACDQTVAALLYGQDFHVACIPVDIIFAVVEFILAEAKWGISIAQANLEMVNLCDALVDTEELTGNYLRLEHLHDDLEQFRAEENAKLDVIDAKWDLVLRILLERDLQWNSGDRSNVNYIDLLDESCDAADQAIQDTEALGYALHSRAKPSLATGRLLIATDPKAALDLCRQAYRLATVGSKALN